MAKAKKAERTPVFRLQLVYPDGTALVFDGGGAFERDMIAACRDAIVARGVGVFRTEAQVAKAVEAGMRDALMDLKRESLKAL